MTKGEKHVKLKKLQSATDEHNVFYLSSEINRNTVQQLDLKLCLTLSEFYGDCNTIHTYIFGHNNSSVSITA